MASPTGVVRGAERSLDDQADEGLGQYAVPKSFDYDPTELEDLREQALQAGREYLEETQPGLTDDEFVAAYNDLLEKVQVDEDIHQKAQEAWAAENLEEDTPFRKFVRGITRREEYVYPGGFDPAADYQDRLEGMAIQNTKFALMLEDANLQEFEALGQAQQGTVSRHEGSAEGPTEEDGGFAFSKKWEALERAAEPGFTDTYKDLIAESSPGSALRSVVGFGVDVVNFWEEDYSETYEGQNRGKRWWTTQSNTFTQNPIYQGHPDAEKFNDVEDPETGKTRPWYESIEARERLGTASDDEIKTYRDALEDLTDLRTTSDQDFIDYFQVYANNRKQWLDNLPTGGVRDFMNSWIARGYNYNFLKNVGVSADKERQTFPRNDQLTQQVSSALGLAELREQARGNQARFDEATRRLTVVLQSIPNDLFPDQSLRDRHMLEYGESAQATRMSNMRNTGFGDFAQVASPVFEVVAEGVSYLPGVDSHDYDPTGSFGTGAKASAQATLQTAVGIAQKVDDAGLFGLPFVDIAPNMSDTLQGLWGSGAYGDFKGFFDNEELIAETEEERKAVLYNLFFRQSRNKLHTSKFFIDVPRFNNFKSEILASKNFRALPQGTNARVDSDGNPYVSRQYARIIDDFQERAVELDMSLEEYLDDSSKMAALEEKLNSIPLAQLPTTIATKILTQVGGYNGIKESVERVRSERERLFGAEDRTIGYFTLEGLGNLTTNTNVEGTTVKITESIPGATLRVGSTILFDPIAETAMDLFFDPFMAVGAQFDRWEWNGRASDRGGLGDWFAGLDEPEAAGFFGRLGEAAIAMGYSKDSEMYDKMTAYGLGLDVLVPGEQWALGTLARPVVGTSRFNRLMQDLPGTPSIDLIRAAYLPEGVFGLGSLQSKIPTKVITPEDAQEALEIAQAQQQADRAAFAASSTSRGIIEASQVRFEGTPLERLFESRGVKQARRQLKDTQGVLGWRVGVRSLAQRLGREGPAPGTMFGVGTKEKIGGIHDITRHFAEELVQNNILQGRSPFEGLGKNTQQDVLEALRVAGVDPQDALNALRDTSRIRTADFMEKATERLEGSDDYTKSVRDLDEYQRLRDAVEQVSKDTGAAANIKKIRGISPIDTYMAMIEATAVALARTRGLDEGLESTRIYIQQVLDAIDFDKVDLPEPEPLFMRGFETKIAEADLSPEVKANLEEFIRPLAEGLSLDDQLKVLNAEETFDFVLRLLIRDRTSGVSNAPKALDQFFRKALDLIDSGGSTLDDLTRKIESLSDDFLERVLRSNLPLDVINDISDEISSLLNLTQERLLRSQIPESRRSPLPETGKTQILETIRKLRAEEFLDDEMSAVLQAMVLALPDRVLRDIRFVEEVELFAQNPDALGATSILGGGPDRVVSAIQLFAYRNEVGLLKASETVPEFVNASVDEMIALHYDQGVAQRGQLMRALAMRLFNNAVNPATGKAFTAFELAEKIAKADFPAEADTLDRLRAQTRIHGSLQRIVGNSKRIGPRTYTFLHELGHAIQMSFLSDSENALLAQAYRDEFLQFLNRDTAYVRGQVPYSQVQYAEWFAENFAEFVITHQLPKVLNNRADSNSILRVFNHLVERLSSFFDSWFRRSVRSREDFHPVLVNLVERLFDGEALPMGSRREVNARLSSMIGVRLEQQGKPTVVAREFGDIDGQYVDNTFDDYIDEAKPLFRTADDAAADNSLLMKVNEAIENRVQMTVAVVGMRPEFIEAQNLMKQSNALRVKRDKATRLGPRTRFTRQLEAVNEQLFALLAGDVQRTLNDGLPEGLIRVTNLTEDGQFQTSLGAFADYDPEAGFYITLEGPRDVILGRVAEYSKAYNQDAMLVRERVKTVRLDKNQPIDTQVAFDDRGVTRGATAKITIPAGFEGGVAKTVMKSIADNYAGATIRLDALADGSSVIELVHVPEWLPEDKRSVTTFCDIVENITDDIESYAKKKNLGEVDVVFDQETVYAVSNSKGTPNAEQNAGYYEYWIERSRSQIRDEGGDASPLFERDETGPGSGPETRESRFQRESQRQETNGSNPILDIPGALDRLGADIRAIVNDRDVIDSGHLSEELVGEFSVQSEIEGGTPHKVVDSEAEAGLRQRVAHGEITAAQAEFVSARLGKASPLENVEIPVEFEVEYILPSTTVEKTIERRQVTASVYPMLKATDFTAGVAGQKVFVPGGFSGEFSFADVQYLARRPIEALAEDAAAKWWSDNGAVLFGGKGSIANFDEIMMQYKDAYRAMLTDLYSKLHESYGVEQLRPNNKDFFKNNRLQRGEKAIEWRQKMEAHLMDVASQYIFAFLSMNTNLMNNQVFAAVARPRGMKDLAQMVDKYKRARQNKGEALSREEAAHILGFALNIGTGTLKDRFGKTNKMLDIETDVAPMVRIQDWSLPGAPLIDIQMLDVAPLNAVKIEGAMSSALSTYGSKKNLIAKLEKQIPATKDPKTKRRKKRELKKAVADMQAADLNYQSLRTKVRSDNVINLTNDVSLSSPANMDLMLQMYEVMLDDFNRVLNGELEYSFFERFPEEDWRVFSDRVASLVPGMATKITMFGLYWQNPFMANIGALDIHMIGLMGEELFKNPKYLDKAKNWFVDWKTIKSEAARNQLKEIAEMQLIRESGEPGFTASDTAIKKRAKEIFEDEIVRRKDLTFEQFLTPEKDNPAYTFWRDQLRIEVTSPESLPLFPTGIKEISDLFPSESARRIDVEGVQKALDKIRRKPAKTEDEKAIKKKSVERVEKTLRAHKMFQNTIDTYGVGHPVVQKAIDGFESKVVTSLDVMSPEYERALNILTDNADQSDLLGSAATRQHQVWDEWRGYVDPHVIVHPGSSMLPAVRPAAMKAVVNRLEDVYPDITDPRVQAAISSRENRLAAGLFGAGFQKLYDSFKEGGFTGKAPFQGRPLPTQLSRGALYMSGADFENPLLTTFFGSGADLTKFFAEGDLDALFGDASLGLVQLLGEDYPAAMRALAESFDNVELPNGTKALTSKGMSQAKDAFRQYWHDRYFTDPVVERSFDTIRDRIAVTWRRLRHRVDHTSPGLRRYFDEWTGILNDAKKEAMFDVSSGPAFKRVRTEVIRSDVLETEAPRKAGEAKEAGKIDLDSNRVRSYLGIKEGDVDVDVFHALQKAVGYVITERSRKKYTNNWVAFSTRTIVPKQQLAQYMGKAQRIIWNVFGDPTMLAKQFDRVDLEVEVVDEFGNVDVEKVTEVLPTGEARVTQIEVINLLEPQQRRLRNLLLTLGSDPKTAKMLQESTLADLLAPGADLSQIPVSHYRLLVDELIRDHVVGVGTGATKEMMNVPKSLGYAAVQQLMRPINAVPFLSKVSDRLRTAFVTDLPLTGRTKEGKKITTSPVIQKLFERRTRQMNELTKWVQTAQQLLKDGRQAAAVMHVVNGLRKTLSQPLSAQNYRKLAGIQNIFTKGNGLSRKQFQEFKDDIVRGFSENYKMTDKERLALEIIEDLYSEFDVLEDAQKRMLAEAYEIIEEGIDQRVFVANQTTLKLFSAFGGSPDQAVKLGREIENPLVDKTFAIRFYQLFYQGRWEELLVELATENLAIGTATIRPGKFSLPHASLEAIMRLRAEHIYQGLVDDMARYGMKTSVDEIAPADIRGAAERRQFVERVKMYIDEELNFGGVRITVNEAGQPVGKLGANLASPKRSAYGELIQGKSGNAAPYSQQAQKRSRERGTFQYQTLEDAPGLRSTRVIHDLEAYQMAMQLIEEWGLKIGTDAKDFELVRFLDGSERLVPPFFKEEIENQITRLAGEASGRMGAGLMAKRTRFSVPEEFGLPRAGPIEFAKATTQQAIDFLFNTYTVGYRLMKMGVTSGLFLPNLAYYTANFIGAQFQVYMTLGAKGYFTTTFGPNSLLSLELAASVFGGQPKNMRWKKVRPLVAPDGTVYTKRQLISMIEEFNITGSFIAAETASSLAEDLKENEPGYWRTMTQEGPYYARPGSPLESDVVAVTAEGVTAAARGAASLAYKPISAVKFYHNQLINFASFIDNYYRVAVFLDGIEKGLAASDAAAVARRALFDYTDLTEFERKTMRTVFIFYSFQRKNMDLFFDTLLTNPNRVFAQFRLARGLNQHFLDGDEILIESEFSIGRLGLAFLNNGMDELVQKNRVNAPQLPAAESFKVLQDLMAVVGAFTPGLGETEEVGNRAIKTAARLNPWIQSFLGAIFEKDFFRGRDLGPTRIPTSFVQYDLLTTGGMFMEMVGANVRALRDYESQEYPGQIMVYEAANDVNYFLLRSGFHGVFPVTPLRDSVIPGFNLPLLDKSLPGVLLRADPFEAVKQGFSTFGLPFELGIFGRSMDTMSRMVRAEYLIPQLLQMEYDAYTQKVEAGQRESLAEYDPNVEGSYSRMIDRLSAAGFALNEDGDVVFARPDGQPVRGERGRLGVDEGFLGLLFNIQTIPTKEAAMLRVFFNEKRRLEDIIRIFNERVDPEDLDVSLRTGVVETTDD